MNMAKEGQLERFSLWILMCPSRITLVMEGLMIKPEDEDK
jgi:hypothetical protein